MRRRLAAICILMPFAMTAQQVGKNLTTSSGKFIGFYEYTPPDYAQNTSVKYPLIIFLHGIGERGNGTTDLPKVKRQGIPRYIDEGNTMTFSWNGKTESFVVLSPQCASNTKWYWEDFHVSEMIRYAKAHLRIDTNRIMLTGLSMGGGGVWSYLVSSIANAGELAAAAPVCGTCITNDGRIISGADVPVWAFHASNDTSATALPGCSIDAVNNINLHHPDNKAIISLYPDGRHFIWDRAWDMTHKYQDPNIFEWFLGQNKSLPPNKMPVAAAGQDVNTPDITDNITLSARSSSDADGQIVRYTWKKISGPAGGNLSASGTIVTHVSGFSAKGIYSYVLQVVDNRVGWSYDTVNINVGVTNPNPPPPPMAVNKLPVSRAGADQVITLPANKVTLNGNASSDADGSIAACRWTKTEGPANYSIADPRNCETSVSGLIPGKYVFRLTVTDNLHSTGMDEMSVLVKKISSQVELTGNNSAPGGDGLKIFPTRVSHHLNISYTSTSMGRTLLSIYSASGVLIRRTAYRKTAVVFISQLHIENLPHGMYFVQAAVEGKAVAAKAFFR
jgi:Putative esterase